MTIKLTTSLLLGVFFAVLGQTAEAQVVLDGSVGIGNPGQLVLPDPSNPSITYDITEDLGDIVGDNLFHSFDLFDVSFGETARFSGATHIQNIISRITGGIGSTVNGRIQSTIQNADVWLINPAGIVFGPDASLDTSGSFHAGTSDYILFADGRYGANLADPANTILTSAPPSAFGFINKPETGIDIYNSALSVSPGKTLSLVGGYVNMQGGFLNAPGGQINLVAVGDVVDGQDALVVPVEDDVLMPGADNSQFGFVTIDDGAAVFVAESGLPSGSVIIRGGGFFMGLSTVFSDFQPLLWLRNDSPGHGGLLDIDVDGLVVLNGQIDAVNLGSGSGSTVSINGSQVFLLDLGVIDTSSFGAGDGGNISLEGTEEVNIVGGRIFAETFSSARGGDIILRAPSIVITAEGRVSANTVDTGDGGSILVEADNLEVSDFGAIDANTFFTGNGGTITIRAGDLQLTGLGTISARTSGDGNGGDIVIELSGDLFMSGGGIEADVQDFFGGVGSGGTISIAANAVVLEERSVINADTDSNFGRGGSIAITANSVSLNGDSQISANTFYDGDGGQIDINTGSLKIAGLSIISSLTLFGSGQGGNLNITADDIEISGGGGIGASTAAFGDGGSVSIDTGTLLIFGSGEFESGLEIPSFIDVSSFTGSSGNGGSLTLRANDIRVLNGGLINASAEGSGNGGSIDIAAGSLEVGFEGSITASSGGEGDGGSISIDAESVLIEELGKISVDGFGRGNGGSIEIDAATIDIIGGEIFAQAFSSGSGGNITLNANSLRVSGGQIFASTRSTDADAGDGGTIEINSGTVSVSNAGSISAGSFGFGNGGSIIIAATDITLDEFGRISVSASDQGAGGSINLSAENLLSITNNSAITASSLFSGGGTISIDAGDSIFLSESRITASSGGENVPGGNISVGENQQPVFFIVVDSEIIAEGGTNAAAGNIDIFTDTFLVDEKSRIEATNELTVTSNISDMTASIAVVDEDLDSGQVLLNDRCAARALENRSSFIIDPARTPPPAPAEYQPSPLLPILPTPGVEQARVGAEDSWTHAELSNTGRASGC